MVDCKETKLRYRADQLMVAPLRILREDGSEDTLGYICVQEGPDAEMQANGSKQAKAILKQKEMKKATVLKPFAFSELYETITTEAQMAQVYSPSSNQPSLTMPRQFNLMFETKVGAMALEDNSNVAYLRPETAQGIFLNYKNVLTSSGCTPIPKVPFGIGQIGKAFRNEITPRNYIFRSREFEQCEIEYFIPPGDSVWPAYHQQWISDAMKFLEDSLGIHPDFLSLDVHADEKLAHYAVACTDIRFTFPFGTQELMGIAARGNYDLTQHGTGSGKSLEYFDEESKERYVPHVIEPSLGVDRVLLAVICSAYFEDVIDGEKRSLLRFHPRVAPVKVSVLPLVKNKEEIVTVARQIYDSLRRRWNVQYDVSGAIGRRYRRADEIGTPFCVTVDFDTIEKDECVTIRDRDTTEQVRIPIAEVMSYLGRAIDGY
jgi:glycyl-tRNA synthetase